MDFLPLAAKRSGGAFFGCPHISDCNVGKSCRTDAGQLAESGGGRCSGPLQRNFPEPIDSDRHEGVDFLALKRSRLHAIASEMMMTAAKKTWAKPQVKKLTDSEVQSLAEAHQPVREMLKSNPRTA